MRPTSDYLKDSKLKCFYLFSVFFFCSLCTKQPAKGGDAVISWAKPASEKERKDREEERGRGRGSRGRGEAGSRLPPGQLRMLVVSRSGINHRVERWSFPRRTERTSPRCSCPEPARLSAVWPGLPPRLFAFLMLFPLFLYFLMQGRGGGEPKCAPDIGKPILLADAVCDNRLLSGQRRIYTERQIVTKWGPTWQEEGNVWAREDYENCFFGRQQKNGGPWYRSGHSGFGYLRLLLQKSICGKCSLPVQVWMRFFVTAVLLASWISYIGSISFKLQLFIAGGWV